MSEEQAAYGNSPGNGPEREAFERLNREQAFMEANLSQKIRELEQKYEALRNVLYKVSETQSARIDKIETELGL